MKRGELIKGIVLVAGAGLTIFALAAVPALAIPVKFIVEEIRKEEGNKFAQERIKRTLYRLKKKKLISLEEIDGELTAIFNEAGKRLIMKSKFNELRILRPQVWDGKWRIVTFDIPEKEKPAREFLREKLKELEFYQLQKSVFIHPFECQREIEIVEDVYEVERYVNFIRADFIDDEEKIKDFFGLG